LNPGHSPETDQVDPGGFGHSEKQCSSVGAPPGFTSRSAKCLPTVPPPAGSFHWTSTLPAHALSGGHGSPGWGPPPGNGVSGGGGSWLSGMSMKTSKKLLG